MSANLATGLDILALVSGLCGFTLAEVWGLGFGGLRTCWGVWAQGFEPHTINPKVPESCLTPTIADLTKALQPFHM